MLIVLIVGLVLLSVLFGVKFVEGKRGNKLFLKRFRRLADEWITYRWKYVCRQAEYGFVRLREFWLTAQWSTRRWLAKKLRKLSRHLHS